MASKQCWWGYYCQCWVYFSQVFNFLYSWRCLIKFANCFGNFRHVLFLMCHSDKNRRNNHNITNLRLCFVTFCFLSLYLCDHCCWEGMVDWIVSTVFLAFGFQWSDVIPYCFFFCFLFLFFLFVCFFLLFLVNNT